MPPLGLLGLVLPTLCPSPVLRECRQILYSCPCWKEILVPCPHQCTGTGTGPQLCLTSYPSAVGILFPAPTTTGFSGFVCPAAPLPLAVRYAHTPGPLLNIQPSGPLRLLLTTSFVCISCCLLRLSTSPWRVSITRQVGALSFTGAGFHLLSK